MEKVSVVIPVYNSGRFIRSTVDSVLSQRYSEIELIVVDDCSTDDTREVLKPYEDDPRFRLILREKNGGIAAGRNTGLKACKGEYIAMLDHDDLWEPDKLERQVRFLKEGGMDAVFSDYYLILGEDGEKIKFQPKKRPGTGVLDDLLRECMIYTSTLIFKRSVLDKAGFLDEEFTYSEDWDWFLRMALKVNVGYLPEYLATRREMPTSFSVVIRGRFIHYIRLYNKLAGSLDKGQRKIFKKNIGKKCYIDARRLMSFGRFGLGIKSYVEAVKKYRLLVFKLPSLMKCFLVKSKRGGTFG
jgi:teichuronic acid biosynthesis glycosyltransferase TuaG